MRKILRKRLPAILMLLVLFLQCLPMMTYAAEGAEQVFYLTAGGIPGDGSMEKPFASFDEVKAAVREVKAAGTADKITVYLRGGYYYLDETLTFTAQDSGSENLEIVYEAYNDEKVVLSMGTPLDGSKFTKVTDPAALARINDKVEDKVLQVDLYSAGGSSLGTMIRRRYMTWTDPSEPILVINDKMQNLSRWPTVGWAWQGAVTGDNSFRYTESVGDKWANAKDVWYHAFGYNLWADEGGPVTIDTADKRIDIGTNLIYGLREGRPYYLYNLLEELNDPGEYYLDRESGIMYIYPTGDLTDADIWFATTTDDIVKFEGASHITLRGLIIEGTCGVGVRMTGSNYNVLDECELRNIGLTAVLTENLSGHNGVTNSYVHDICMSGIRFDTSSANFPKQEPSANYVENCHIENWGVTAHGYHAAIRLFGIGDRVSHNRLNNSKHMAVYLNGNDNIIEYNEIYDVLNMNEDMAAIYTWSDWTNLGHVIRYNYMHDIFGNTQGPLERIHFSPCIYFDDDASFGTIYGNVLRNIDTGIFLSGGQRMNIYNNMFIDTRRYSVDLNNWICAPDADIVEANRVLMETYKAGDTSMSKYGNTSGINHRYRKQYWEQNYIGNEEVYNAKYPFLENFITEGNPFLPQLSTLKDNITIGEIWPDDDRTYTWGIPFHVSDLARSLMKEESNNEHILDYPEFVDPEAGNYNVADYSKIHEVVPGFEELDITKSGPVGQANLELGAFNTISPVQGAEGQDAASVLFCWELSSGADEYRLVIATDKDFKDVVFDELIRYNYKTVENLKFGRQKYYWKVEASSTSYAYPGTRWNDNGVQTFRTHMNGELIYFEYDLAVANAQNLLRTAVEGEVGGTYPAGSKAEFENQLLAIEESLSGKVTQKLINQATTDVKKAQTAFQVKIHFETIDIGEFLADQGGWTYKSPDTGVNAYPVYTFNQDGSLTIHPSTDKEGRNGYGWAFYTARRLENYQTIKMKMKVDYLDYMPNREPYHGISVRCASTSQNLYMNPSYSMLLHNSGYELQDFNMGGHVLDSKSSDTFLDEQFHEVEFGALDVAEGVRLIVKVDGETIFDHIDANTRVPNAGYFGAYAMEQELTIKSAEAE